MADKDIAQFADAQKKAAAVFWADSTKQWDAVVNAIGRLSMSEMLRALDPLTHSERRSVLFAAIQRVSGVLLDQIRFATDVIDKREIRDYGLPVEQVNDGREYLGCTRLDDAEVRKIITAALRQAKDESHKHPRFSDTLPCCRDCEYAWTEILVEKRREFPGASLNANYAAAAHYMLARYHVCAAKAIEWQMNLVIDEYDDKKRRAIRNGDTELKSMALTAGNRPFPPDFAIEDWAKKGSQEGEADRLRCNPDETRPPLPKISNQNP